MGAVASTDDGAAGALPRHTSVGSTQSSVAPVFHEQDADGTSVFVPDRTPRGVVPMMPGSRHALGNAWLFHHTPRDDADEELPRSLTPEISEFQAKHAEALERARLVARDALEGLKAAESEPLPGDVSAFTAAQIGLLRRRLEERDAMMRTLLQAGLEVFTAGSGSQALPPSGGGGEDFERKLIQEQAFFRVQLASFQHNVKGSLQELKQQEAPPEAYESLLEYASGHIVQLCQVKSEEHLKATIQTQKQCMQLQELMEQDQRKQTLLQKELKEMEADRQLLLDKFHGCQTEKDGIVADVTKKCTEAKEAERAARGETLDLRRALEEVQSKLKENEDKLASSNDDHESTKGKLVNTSGEVDQLKAALKASRENESRLEDSLNATKAALEGDHTNMAAQLQAAVGEISNLKAASANTEDKLRRYDEYHTSQRHFSERLQAELADVDNKLKAATEERDAFAERMAAAEKEEVVRKMAWQAELESAKISVNSELRNSLTELAASRTKTAQLESKLSSVGQRLKMGLRGRSGSRGPFHGGANGSGERHGSISALDRRNSDAGRPSRISVGSHMDGSHVGSYTDLDSDPGSPKSWLGGPFMERRESMCSADSQQRHYRELYEDAKQETAVVSGSLARAESASEALARQLRGYEDRAETDKSRVEALHKDLLKAQTELVQTKSASSRLEMENSLLSESASSAKEAVMHQMSESTASTSRLLRQQHEREEAFQQRQKSLLANEKAAVDSVRSELRNEVSTCREATAQKQEGLQQMIEMRAQLSFSEASTQRWTQQVSDVEQQCKRAESLLREVRSELHDKSVAASESQLKAERFKAELAQHGLESDAVTKRRAKTEADMAEVHSELTGRLEREVEAKSRAEQRLLGTESQVKQLTEKLFRQMEAERKSTTAEAEKSERQVKALRQQLTLQEQAMKDALGEAKNAEVSELENWSSRVAKEESESMARAKAMEDAKASLAEMQQTLSTREAQLQGELASAEEQHVASHATLTERLATQEEQVRRLEDARAALEQQLSSMSQLEDIQRAQEASVFAAKEAENASLMKRLEARLADEEAQTQATSTLRHRTDTYVEHLTKKLAQQEMAELDNWTTESRAVADFKRVAGQNESTLQERLSEQEQMWQAAISLQGQLAMAEESLQAELEVERGRCEWLLETVHTELEMCKDVQDATKEELYSANIESVERDADLVLCRQELVELQSACHSAQADLTTASQDHQSEVTFYTERHKKLSSELDAMQKELQGLHETSHEQKQTHAAAKMDWEQERVRTRENSSELSQQFTSLTQETGKLQSKSLNLLEELSASQERQRLAEDALMQERRVVDEQQMAHTTWQLQLTEQVELLVEQNSALMEASQAQGAAKTAAAKLAEVSKLTEAHQATVDGRKEVIKAFMDDRDNALDRLRKAQESAIESEEALKVTLETLPKLEAEQEELSAKAAGEQDAFEAEMTRAVEEAASAEDKTETSEAALESSQSLLKRLQVQQTQLRHQAYSQLQMLQKEKTESAEKIEDFTAFAEETEAVCELVSQAKSAQDALVDQRSMLANKYQDQRRRFRGRSPMPMRQPSPLAKVALARSLDFVKGLVRDWEGLMGEPGRAVDNPEIPALGDQLSALHHYLQNLSSLSPTGDELDGLCDPMGHSSREVLRKIQARRLHASKSGGDLVVQRATSMDAELSAKKSPSSPTASPTGRLRIIGRRGSAGSYTAPVTIVGNTTASSTWAQHSGSYFFPQRRPAEAEEQTGHMSVPLPGADMDVGAGEMAPSHINSPAASTNGQSSRSGSSSTFAFATPGIPSSSGAAFAASSNAAQALGGAVHAISPPSTILGQPAPTIFSPGTPIRRQVIPRDRVVPGVSAPQQPGSSPSSLTAPAGRSGRPRFTCGSSGPRVV
eukprot:TRINITY_DN81158_c0_g1_i1.p1 TRINITY_DN81158_c0_g1~~TRINITY_DN81158_c0_g1_i1.p1  ORF type:complete len:1898 (+),score=625.64 TRINITY_DN81158_c0_g1_i1:87-5780(+)